MKFLDAEGNWQTGEVWSPGPVANSVWVLLSDGTSRAVRFPTSKIPEHHEVQVLQDVLTPKRYRGREMRPWSPEHGMAVLQSQERRLEAKFAPPLPGKKWRSVLPPELCP